ncbi:hypothetical protein PG994_014094 [Apiospora phragmitis]|uniref:Uncharacterized protein n=1 Tax=Apiospora phragmitis TaxID=2905665 RepID=A0ABR1T3C7_9PEZI
MSRVIRTRVTTGFLDIAKLKACIGHLRKEALKRRARPESGNPIMMFGCEPSPIYVFSTGVEMKPSTTLQSVRQRLTGNCHLLPDLGDSSLSKSFMEPLDVYSWLHQPKEEAKAKVPRQLKKTTFNPETIRSSVNRTWSTYYGPGHAMVLALLDLTKPPFRKTGEDQLAAALCRSLDRALAPDPQMRRQLRLTDRA